MKNSPKYEKATGKHPLMGLDNRICTNPQYWCRLHQVWLSEEDDEKLERAKKLASEYQSYEIYHFPKLGIDKVSVRGIPLKNKFCKGYSLYTWNYPENKPNYDWIKVQYCYVSVTIDNVEHKIQVLLDHDAQMVYIDTASLITDCVTATIQEIQRILNEE